jgi:hypothetical protein
MIAAAADPNSATVIAQRTGPVPNAITPPAAVLLITIGSMSIIGRLPVSIRRKKATPVPDVRRSATGS